MENTLQTSTKEEQLTEEKPENIATVDFKMVTFSLSGKDYAIDIMRVKEIAKAGRFTYVPNTAPFVLGVYNLRGEIIPIIDLRLFFNIEVEERKDNQIENVIIVSVEDQVFGIVVDEIDKVVGIQKSSIQPPHPLFGDINIKYIYGVVESEERLYILLDIERIFSNKIKEEQIEESKKLSMAKSNQKQFADKSQNSGSSQNRPSSPQPSEKEAAPAPQKEESVDYTFIVEGLSKFKNFNVTELNSAWTKQRFEKWISEKGAENFQLTSEAQADEFLKDFYSENTGSFWSESYAKRILSILPDNSAKQIIVWNPGCEKGCESYSLACILKKRYPDARIRIYAQDMDLISISNASMLSIPDQMADTWYGPYLTKNVSGNYVFAPEIKEMIMFEYHDCSNTNAVPAADIIFCRDVLSFLPEDVQNSVLLDFEDKLKGNGIMILGENESLAGKVHWTEQLKENISIYTK